LNDFDSTMLGESAGAVMVGIAPCGLPRLFTPDIQPRQFVGIPDVDAEEGKRARAQADLFALLQARDREQELGGVLALVRGGFAKWRLIRSIHRKLECLWHP